MVHFPCITPRGVALGAKILRSCFRLLPSLIGGPVRLTHLALALASLALTAGPAKKKPKVPEGQVHVVRQGETAASIARKHGLSLAELTRLNPGKNLSKLSLGARLVLSKKGPAPTLAHAEAPSEATPNPAVPPIPMTPMPGLPGPRAKGLANMERLLPAPAQAEPSREPQAPPKTSREPMSQSLNPVVLPSAPAVEPADSVASFLPADPDRLDLLWPVETRTISSGWGPRMRTRTVRAKNSRKKRVRYRGRHRGLDLTAPQGTDVYAALDGQVVTMGKHRQYGNYVVLDHGNGVVTLYAHHRFNLVQEGDVVHRGQKIAEVGRTGNATGPHLHFELRINGVHQNPLPYLNDEEEIPADLQAMNALVRH